MCKLDFVQKVATRAALVVGTDTQDVQGPGLGPFTGWLFWPQIPVGRLSKSLQPFLENPIRGWILPCVCHGFTAAEASLWLNGHGLVLVLHSTSLVSLIPGGQRHPELCTNTNTNPLALRWGLGERASAGHSQEALPCSWYRCVWCNVVQVAARCHSLGAWFEEYGAACALHCGIRVPYMLLPCANTGAPNPNWKQLRWKSLIWKKKNGMK